LQSLSPNPGMSQTSYQAIPILAHPNYCRAYHQNWT
jgi:hypothetical protein